MRAQTEAAVAASDAVLFLVDARAGLTPLDRAFADLLRRSGKPVILIANKSEGRAGEAGALEAYALGLGDPVAISAEHGEGLGDLLRCAARGACPNRPSGDDASADGAGPIAPIRVAVVGRPNSGKSTLINRLIGEERLLAGPEAGITRDAIAVDLDWRGKPFRLYDTAGMRRRARIEEKLEKLSVADALGAIRFAEVVVLLMDVERPFEEQDLRIADLIEREGRALVLAMNKWDLVTRPGRSRQAARGGRPLAAAGQGRADRGGLRAHRPRPRPADAGGRRRPCGMEPARARPTRSIAGSAQATADHPPPAVSGRRIRLNYVTQPKTRPPSFVAFCTRADAVPDAYRRYLVNALRDSFRPARHADPAHAAGEEQSVCRTQVKRARAPTADAARRAGVHLRHRHARHAGARDDHPGAAEAGRALHGRQHGGRRRGVRPVQHRLGVDAVPVLAAASARCPIASGAGR